jgi:hypothetical protein
MFVWMIQNTVLPLTRYYKNRFSNSDHNQSVITPRVSE